MGFGPIIISGDNSGTAEAELREGLNKGCWSGCWGCSGSHHGGSKSVVHSSPSSFKAFLMWSSPPEKSARSVALRIASRWCAADLSLSALFLPGRRQEILNESKPNARDENHLDRGYLE